MPNLRPVAACALPALVIALAWASIEEPRRAGDALLVAAFALTPALFVRTWLRGVAAAIAATGAWIVFGARPWELLPFRDERVLGPAAERVDEGIGDFYRVLLPFDPTRNPEMHTVVLLAIFGFVLAAALLAASGRPVGAAAVTIAGAGWPATLEGGAVAVGALALAAALSIPLVLRVRSGPALVSGVTAAAVVVGGAAWATTSTAVAREPAIAWESWDFTGLPAPTTSVRFAWDSNYEGIRFPPTPTVVLTVQGPERPHYWRASTLDLFVGDHWIEDRVLLGPVGGEAGPLPLDALTPRRALRFYELARAADPGGGARGRPPRRRRDADGGRPAGDRHDLPLGRRRPDRPQPARKGSALPHLELRAGSGAVGARGVEGRVSAEDRVVPARR